MSKYNKKERNLTILDNKKTFTDKKFVTVIASLCCLLWGSAYPAIKSGYVLFNIASGDIPSKLVFAGYRFIIAGILVLIIAQVYGNKIFTKEKVISSEKAIEIG